MFLSLVPIVLSSSHTTPPVAPKSTRLIQDGDRYIFLVEDTRGTKVSSVPMGTPASATKEADEGTETEGGNQEEGEEETGESPRFDFLESVQLLSGLSKIFYAERDFIAVNCCKALIIPFLFFPGNCSL